MELVSLIAIALAIVLLIAMRVMGVARSLRGPGQLMGLALGLTGVALLILNAQTVGVDFQDLMRGRGSSARTGAGVLLILSVAISGCAVLVPFWLDPATAGDGDGAPKGADPEQEGRYRSLYAKERARNRKLAARLGEEEAAADEGAAEPVQD